MIPELVVAIDSSLRHGGSVALAEGGELLGERFHDPAQGYAESFFGLLDGALASAGKQPGEIRAVGVVAGPGSFTGLRIGVMTAKSLAFARHLPLYAAGTLELLASRALPREDGSVLAVMDAGRDAFYAGAYRGSVSSLRELEEARRVPSEVLRDRVETLSRPLVIVPDGELTTSRLEALGIGAGDPVEILEPAPLAGLLARGVGEERSWIRRVDPARLLPIYLGPSQAERVHGLDLAEEVHRPRAPRREGGA